MLSCISSHLSTWTYEEQVEANVMSRKNLEHYGFQNIDLKKKRKFHLKSLGSHTIKHFHAIAQIVTKPAQTFQIYSQNLNYWSKNQRGYLLPSYFVVVIEVSLSF